MEGLGTHTLTLGGGYLRPFGVHGSQPFSEPNDHSYPNYHPRSAFCSSLPPNLEKGTASVLPSCGGGKNDRVLSLNGLYSGVLVNCWDKVPIDALITCSARSKDGGSSTIDIIDQSILNSQ